eukprot:3945183-Prymnesium_polylepis.1
MTRRRSFSTVLSKQRLRMLRWQSSVRVARNRTEEEKHHPRDTSATPERQVAVGDLGEQGAPRLHQPLDQPSRVSLRDGPRPARRRKCPGLITGLAPLAHLQHPSEGLTVCARARTDESERTGASDAHEDDEDRIERVGRVVVHERGDGGRGEDGDRRERERSQPKEDPAARQAHSGEVNFEAGR